MIKLQVIGNIGQDARVNDVNGNRSINFSVAYNRKFTDKDGVIVEKTTWVNCTYWRTAKQSVEVAKFLTAGTKVFCEGQPDVSTYQDRDGHTRATLNMNIISLELISSTAHRDDDEEPAETAAPEATPAPKAKQRL